MTPQASGTAWTATLAAVLAVTHFLSGTVTRPPWVGLAMLCAGTFLFEIALIACLPIPREIRQLTEVRVLFALLALLPAVGAVVIAIAAHRKAPILPEIGTPAARVPSVGAPISRWNRWRELDR